MDRARAALFVFAHQDDEVAAASRIAFEIRRGTEVFSVFLTDGGAPKIRDEESIAALGHLGVSRGHVFFPGSEIPIPDGQLPFHLDTALEHLELAAAGIEVGTVYCLAWEGGHQDHDASHLVAVAFARRRHLLDHCFELPLYRGAYGPFFRVLSPSRRSEGWVARRISMREGLSFSRLGFRYKSQRRSWIGLFPEAFLKLAILRRESMRAVDVARIQSPPLAGSLFYERRFGFPARDFASATRPFIERHLS
jgi:LmbE family N-acetylglucosaminyl deacetylase